MEVDARTLVGSRSALDFKLNETDLEHIDESFH